eukprot:Gb_12992 [translate_table: standard]
MFSPHLSNEIKKWVKSMLYLGVPGDVIFDNHTLNVEAKVAIDGKSSHRDDFLTRQDIYNLEAQIKASSYKLQSKEDDSVRGWIQQHHDRVFFYQDMLNNQPFILGIQSTWQLEQMVKFGKNNLIATDSTFGINKLKYPLFTLIVFDTHQNGVPVAWIISSSSSTNDIQNWMEKIQSRIHELDPTWRPSAFMVDDVAAEINAISDVFGCCVLLCLWHVCSWLKNLTKKCHDYMVRREMFKDLGDIMYNQSHATNIMETIECFMQKDNTLFDFMSNVNFMKYHIDMWVKAMRRLPHSNQETNGAIEAYHGMLKDRLSREARTGSSR